jgi:hypothetical protein
MLHTVFFSGGHGMAVEHGWSCPIMPSCSWVNWPPLHTLNRDIREKLSWLIIYISSVLRIRIRKDPHHLAESGILDAGSGS